MIHRTRKRGCPVELGNGNDITYRDIAYDSQGFANPVKFLPTAFDLVMMKIRRGALEIINPISGWWTGNRWDGKNVEPGDKILGWKFKGVKNEYE